MEDTTADRIQRYASDHGMSNTEALEQLVLKGLQVTQKDKPPLYAAVNDTDNDEESEVVELTTLVPLLREHIDELKADKTQLREDLNAEHKRADKLADQLTQAQQIAINAQALQHENKHVGILETIKRKLLPQHKDEAVTD